MGEGSRGGYESWVKDDDDEEGDDDVADEEEDELPELVMEKGGRGGHRGWGISSILKVPRSEACQEVKRLCCDQKDAWHSLSASAKNRVMDAFLANLCFCHYDSLGLFAFSWHSPRHCSRAIFITDWLQY